MGYKTDKTNIFLIIYYAILMAVLLSWSDNLNPPPMVFRLAFLSAVILPTFWEKEWTLPVMLLFIITGTQGFSYSYMPYDTYIYVIIMVLLALLYGRFQKRNIRLPWILIALFIYVTMLNYIISVEWHLMSESLLLCLLFCLFIDAGDEKQLEMVSIAFAISSLVLSFQFFKYFSTTAVLTSSGFEQAGWADRNYYGTIVGMGALASIIQLFTCSKNDVIKKILYIVTIVVVVITLSINGSRGAVLSLGGAILILFMLSKLTIREKIAIVIGIAVMFFVLYNYNVFDYLVYRVENDDGTGSGRMIILQNKYNAYKEVGAVGKIFGLGYSEGTKLGYNNELIGFHNEFFAMLVEYGIVGIFMLLVMLIGPCWKYRSVYTNKQASAVVSLCSYFIITGFTLEPLTSGFCSFFLFYLYIIMWCKYRLI